MTEETKSNAGRLALGAVVALAIGVVIVMFAPQPETAIVAQAPVTPQAVAVAEPVVESPVVPKGPVAPRFDTFRVEADGSMVIAGRAEPGQVVAIMLAGAELVRTTADASGNFVVLPMADASPDPRSLYLLADPDAKAVRSETSYIVAPIAAPPPVIAQVEPPATEAQPEVEETAQAVIATPDVAPTAPVAPVAPAIDEVATQPQSPTILQADAEGVRVVQSTPNRDAANVGLDAITYDPQGEVQISGRATGDGSVQIYLDNEPVTNAPVTEGGDWRVDLPEVETGVYTLRVDEVDTAGAVVSRLETPFKREEAADVAAVLAAETSEDGFDIAVRTVQPGSTLWAIAEENLGNGIFYVQVYEANSDLIRDPDLIYPGQIFRIPEMNQ
ncbi:LysM peptidoglycan-binding domain-containing protein [Loktanella sp. S4079]|uniref:LysM peptidoglycan-binding domain-containing protein n=1 Tax=Loktanella sp. S4079 TaxID=579483 RepID=UPI0005FA8BFF|nr:LysM peptidoglycan-binding domain-containing protein [Loktanella sp. S4079]KJZ20377.1 peptidoglycan-binding protein [Loktanella sp. S4079]